MKKIILTLLAITLVNSSLSAKDVHTFSCEDSNNSKDVGQGNSNTEFTWVKNGEVIFNRIFKDAFSQKREQFVTFYCQGNIIRYRLHNCLEPEVMPFCENDKTEVEPILELRQKSVDVSATLVDGSAYEIITHYETKTNNNSQLQITGLSFINNVDQDNGLSEMEIEAAKQYNYTLMGPESELVSGVASDNGKLVFDLSDSPISVDGNRINIGIAAQPKQNLEPTNNSGIRWVLNPAIGGRGVEALQNGRPLLFDEIEILNSKLQIFSRGISGLRLSHFNPPVILTEPSQEPQSFYRMRVENISSEGPSQLARLTFEMRLIGIQKDVGDLLVEDFSLVEIGPAASSLGVPDHTFYKIEDQRNDEKSFSFQVTLDNFVVEPNTSRGLEFRVANTVNDEQDLDDDDGVAIQMRNEPSLNVSKSFLSELSDAFWVWTDFSGEVVGGQRNDWQSGVNLEVNNQPIMVKE